MEYEKVSATGAYQLTAAPVGSNDNWADGIVTFKLDTTSPAVTNVTTTTSAGTYPAGTVIPITVTFSKPVAVFGTPTIALNAGGGAVAAYASGSGTNTITFNYTAATGQNVSKLDYSSTGALTLAGGYIYDFASNVAVLTLPATGGDGLAAKSIAINTTTPAVTAVTTTTPAGRYAVGTVIPITFTFNEPVTVTGTPQLTLNTTPNATVNYASGSRNQYTGVQLHGSGRTEQFATGLHGHLSPIAQRRNDSRLCRECGRACVAGHGRRRRLVAKHRR